MAEKREKRKKTAKVRAAKIGACKEKHGSQACKRKKKAGGWRGVPDQCALHCQYYNG